MINILMELKRSLNSHNTDKRIKAIIKKLFLRLQKYWYIYDLDHGTTHSQIFETLYLKPYKMIYADIQEKLFVTKSTLDRYVSKYNRLAKLLIEKDYKNRFLKIKSP